MVLELTEKLFYYFLIMALSLLFDISQNIRSNQNNLLIYTHT